MPNNTTVATATAEAAVTTATAKTTFTTAAEAAAEAAGAGRTRLHGACFVHDQITAATVLAVQALDSGLCFGIAAHFHKAEALGTAGVTLHHDLGAADIAKFAESLLQIVVAERVRQVADVEFVAHGRLQEKSENAMEP